MSRMAFTAADRKRMRRAADLLEHEARVIWDCHVDGYPNSPDYGKVTDPWAKQKHQNLTGAAADLRTMAMRRRT